MTSAASRALDAYRAPASPAGWPDPLGAAAMHGLAGEFVEIVEPHSEADPAALLIQLLVGFGNVIGRGPYFLAEADFHRMNLFTILVGSTSKGRKGSSLGQVRKVLAGVDDEWNRSRVVSGMSSGEGLIWRVRDPELREESYDKGDQDKRLLVIESEFASTLKVMARQGNTRSWCAPGRGGSVPSKSAAPVWRCALSPSTPENVI